MDELEEVLHNRHISLNVVFFCVGSEVHENRMNIKCSIDKGCWIYGKTRNDNVRYEKIRENLEVTPWMLRWFEHVHKYQGETYERAISSVKRGKGKG